MNSGCSKYFTLLVVFLRSLCIVKNFVKKKKKKRMKHSYVFTEEQKKNMYRQTKSQISM